MKKCPYCAEEIQNDAIKCKHCGEFLAAVPPRFYPASFSSQETAADALPWYFRPWAIFIALFSVGPIALPLIWWHPWLSVAWKAILTLAVLLFTWGCFLLTEALYQQLMDHYKILKDGGLI